MAASSSASSKVSLKLLIDTETNKVLFAEADKEFFDFLFHILSLPIGTVIKLPIGVKETAEGGGGFVKGVVTYMVMDDLEVKPMSTISSITMLNKSEIGSLQRKDGDIGNERGSEVADGLIAEQECAYKCVLGLNGAVTCFA